MKKTVEDYIIEMESTNILKSGNKYTFSEYSEELLRFQSLICKLITNGEFRDDMRIEEAMFIMEGKARTLGLRDHAAIHNAVLSMKTLAKEISIIMSGVKGEALVSKTLEYLNRPNTRVFRNIYISDGISETELDFVILTDRGVIILENKKIKSDRLTITEEGRLVIGNDESHGKLPLSEKMVLKRHLLKEALEKAVSDKGLDITTISVDSYIVFTGPYNCYIDVEDCYRKERWCFRSSLNKRIENHIGHTYYKPSQLNELEHVLENLQANPKRYPADDVDFGMVRMNIATAMALLQDEEPEADEPEAPAAIEISLEVERDEPEVAAEQEDPAATELPPEADKAAPAAAIENPPRHKKEIHKLDKHSKEAIHMRRNRILAASVVAGVIISTAAAMIAHRS